MNDLKSVLPGVWKLKSRIDTTASGERIIDPIMGADPAGILCFSSDHFAAQFMKRDRSANIPAPQSFKGSNNSIAVNGYDAYFGTYALDAPSGTLKTLLEGSVNPSNIGSLFERHIEIHGDELTVQLSTTATDGRPITRKLTFTRLS
jgi:Lipocalin-like domain